ncbi:SafA/ExsA family spore coat assembly protein [Fervidibacillus albus]|uniref:SafA/ExsA family spore coat assembly protein n=1 Tax=Fervidibacillus albus TaxID=2980026 RepID=UPI0023B344E9|nr:SafA/ExsA family spore coat assembly protein [Fervidibacillus albus]
MKIHIVQKGDTLWKIAQKYGVDFEQLKSMNTHLSNPDMIMPGMKIKIPDTGGTIKKETPMYKKEMPIQKGDSEVEHPFKEMKPSSIPVEKEQPKEKIKEVPKPIFMPKYPHPVYPEIDINNYYTVNMAKMQVDHPEPMMPPQMPPQMQPQMPPEEEIDEVDEELSEVDETMETTEMPEQQFYPQMMYPAVPCIPVTPVMPGSGIPCYPMPLGQMQMMQPMYYSPSPEQMAMVDPSTALPTEMTEEMASMEQMHMDNSAYGTQEPSSVSPMMNIPYIPHNQMAPMGQGMNCNDCQSTYSNPNFVAPVGFPMQYLPPMPISYPTGNWTPGWQGSPNWENGMNYAPWMMAPWAQTPSMGYPSTMGMNVEQDDDE